jgi:anti-sigma factor RsiW
MTCKEALELVEPIAAGDVEADAAARAHFESCPSCAATLATARRLEAVLSSREAPLPPPRFTAIVIQRIHRDRWRAEQNVDRLFNLAMVAALVLVVGGLFALTNVSGVLSAAAGTWALMSTVGTQVAHDAVPSLNTYVAAAGLLASALGMWWWAERTLSI